MKVPSLKRLNAVLILPALVVALVMQTARSHADDTSDDVGLQPVKTSACLVEGTFSCQEYVYSYSVRGVSCTEDCLALSGLNSCELRNRCHWDPASGCFLKDVCVEISSINTCRRWNSKPICY